MKFLSLKEAIEKVIPKFKVPEEKPELPVVPFYNPGEKKQTVVGGDLLRTPVNKTAAMVVRRAPWWARAPSEPMPTAPTPEQLKPIEPSKPRNRKERRKGMSQTIKVNNPLMAYGETKLVPKPSDVQNSEIASEVIKKTDETLDRCEDLARRATDARASLEIMANSWNETWGQFISMSDQRLLHLRQTRMAFDTETKILMASLREVRQFFLDKNHEGEVARLREFVDLCERLQKLKQSGFLDTVADTMLKLT